jgi:hypothetical protein
MSFVEMAMQNGVILSVAAALDLHHDGTRRRPKDL